METLTKGDVVIFPFPYTDLTSRRMRPCLVLSNEMGQDVLLCQITSKNVQPDGFCVELGKNETKNGSLELDSLIRSNMLFTASKSQIARKICSLKSEKYGEVVNAIIRLVKA